MTKLLYQGHGSYRITTNNEKIIYVDPYSGVGYEKKADIVLITHEHYDHNKLELINLEDSTIVIRSKDILINNKYLEFNIDNIKIIGTPAYNKNHDKNKCVGFFIYVDSLLIYAAGDTSMTAEMNEYPSNIDYALLPVDGIYNMDAKEATVCANIFKPKHAIPIHTHEGILFDEEIAKEFTYINKLLIRPNEEIELTK